MPRRNSIATGFSHFMRNVLLNVENHVQYLSPPAGWQRLRPPHCGRQSALWPPSIRHIPAQIHPVAAHAVFYRLPTAAAAASDAAASAGGSGSTS